MPHNINGKLMTILIILLLLNTYLVKLEVVDVILVMIGLGSIVYFNRKILKELSIWQNLGILTLFVGTVALLASILYFVARPVVHLISVDWVRYIVQIGIIIVTLFPAIVLLYKGMSKITDGKFPNTEIELAPEAEEYPVNEEVQQLVRDGEVIKAVKLSRELYGYSLLEAKRYVDSLK